MHRIVPSALVLTAVSVVLGACAPTSERSDALDALEALEPAAVTAPSPSEPAPTEPATSTTVSARRQECDAFGRTASLRPTGPADPTAIAPGSSMAEIRDRGYLVVGVDENTFGFGHRDRETGQIVGFEPDLAYEIAKRIFGPDAGPEQVRFVPVVTAEKTPFVENGTVDMTVSAVSMTCGRWEDVAFSSEYYTAHQEFLVRKDSTVRDVGDLDGATVCVTEKSSSIDILEEHVPAAEWFGVPARTECLVALQEGDADAYFGHDSFIYGMLGQDRTVEVRPGILAPDVTESNYGIAISHDRHDLVRFVNGVLEDLRDDGTWAALHSAWLQAPPPDGIGLPPATPPTAEYRD
jgi:polar amino acid transport system substrate-binding protein